MAQVSDLRAILSPARAQLLARAAQAPRLAASGLSKTWEHSSTLGAWCLSTRAALSPERHDGRRPGFQQLLHC